MNVKIWNMHDYKRKYCRRDQLAICRTHLANKRTLLSYWRTSLAFLILGAYLTRQTPIDKFLVPAIMALLFGAILFIFGTVKFYQFKQIINKS
jgi:putative membrane protein